MSMLVTMWWQWMVSMLWQASLLVLIIGFIDLLIRRWVWPQIRHGLWLLVVIKLLIPPGLTLPGAVLPDAFARINPGLAINMPKAETQLSGPARNTAESTAAPLGETAASRSAFTGPGQQPLDSGARAASPWPAIAFAVWLGGVIVLSSVLVLRMRRLARWHREQEARPTIPSWFHEILIETSDRLGLERVPAIVFSDQAVTPAVYGLLRPVLLLPAHYTDTLSRHEAEHVLLHEMAHLKRGDLFVHAVFLLLQIIYWFNPFVAFARRQVKHVREICCDLTVAGMLREKTAAYRKTLVDTARHLLSESLQPGMGLVGVFEEPYKVLARMRWLDRPTWEKRRQMIVASWFVVALAAPVLLPMATTSAGNSLSAEPQNEPAGLTSESRESGHHTYVRSVFRSENLILGFRVSSQDSAISETWVGDDIISVSERDRSVIFNRGRQSLTLIDHRSESWVEADLPLDVTAVLGEDLQQKRRKIRTTGEVEATGDSRRILGRRCAEYVVSSWNNRGGSLSNPQSFSVWTTTDVPFDISLLDEVLLDLRLLYNRDAKYRSELTKVRGLQMRLQMRRGSIWAAKRWVDEVVEISSRVPPPGTYRPPDGYRQLQQFENLEF